MPRLPLLPVAMLFAASCLWGVCIPIMKALGIEQGLLAPAAGSLGGSAASLCFRFAIAAIAVMVLTGTSPLKIRASEWKHGIVLGAFTAASMFLQVDGLNYTEASTAGFLIALYCVLVPLFAWAAGTRRMSPILLLCCAFVLAGLAVLTGFDPRSFSLGRGEWENLGAACLFAGQILWVGRAASVAMDPMRITLVLCLSVACACLAALAFLPGGLPALWEVHGSGRALGLTLFLAVLGTAFPFMIMNRYQPSVGPVAAGFIYCIEPITAALGAFFLPELLVRNPTLYPNESLSVRLAAGGALILAANLLITRDRPRAA